MEVVRREPDRTCEPTQAPGRGAARDPSMLGLLLLFLVLVAVLRAPTFSDRVFNADEAYLATQAQVLNSGGRLYVDTVDRKPPVVPYLYAAVFWVTGSDSLVPVRLLAMLAQVLTAVLLAAEARRRLRWRHAAVCAGVGYLLAATAFHPTDALAANFEVFMLPVMTAALLLGARDRPIAAGATLGVATLTKQTAATALLPLAYLAWRARRWRGLLELGLAFVAWLVGAAILFGPHDFFFWVFSGNRGYVDVGGAFGYAVWLGAATNGLVPPGKCGAAGAPAVCMEAPAGGRRPLAVARLGCGCGRDRVPLLPALLPAARPTTDPARGARTRLPVAQNANTVAGRRRAPGGRDDGILPGARLHVGRDAGYDDRARCGPVRRAPHDAGPTDPGLGPSARGVLGIGPATCDQVRHHRVRHGSNWRSTT